MIIRKSLLLFIALNVNIGCGMQVGDENSDNQIDTDIDNSQDDHSQGVVKCESHCVLNEDGSATLQYLSFNGGLCAEVLKDNMEICKSKAEEVPEIEMEEDQGDQDLQDAQDALNDGVL